MSDCDYAAILHIDQTLTSITV